MSDAKTAEEVRVEAAARAINDILEGPINNQDFKRQTRQWELSLRLAAAALKAVATAP